MRGEISLRNLVSGRRFAVYAEARRAKARENSPVPSAVPLGQTAIIAIRTEADTVQACATAEDMASFLPFSSFEQAFLTAGAASLARMILNWPAQGEIAVAIVGKADVRGIAIVARFKDKTGHESVRRRPLSTLCRRIEEIGVGRDCFDESGPDGETIATLVKWSHPDQQYGEEPDVS